MLREVDKKKECEFEIDRLVELEDLRKFGVFYDSEFIKVQNTWRLFGDFRSLY